MLCNLSQFNLSNKVIAVALSGGSDSVALLHFLNKNKKDFNFTLKAINIEHGIRGEDSVEDSRFVENLCAKLRVPLIFYQVDALSYSKENKLSLEEGARKLRYDCFFDAIDNNLCALIATAHHLKDNAETVLFNLFRGSGLKGLTGINQIEDKIIRPLIDVKKEEIDKYILDNGLSYVVDKTNFDQNYSRNYIRHQILPLIEKRFPEAESSIWRFSAIAREENDFLESSALSVINARDDKVEISLPCHTAILRRASILALKHLGIKKDWEKIHIDDILSLTEKENGKIITLPKEIFAVKEYDKIVIYKSNKVDFSPFPFKLGQFKVNAVTYSVQAVEGLEMPDLKKGLYFDLDKLPKTAVIRLKQEGDIFTKFGGGTKSLGDYFTDKKIPLKDRNYIPLIADGNRVLAIFGVEISNDIKVDNDTARMVSLNIDLQ